MGKTIEEMMSPDDNIVFRCLRCQEYFLPREYHVMVKRWRGKDGYSRAVGYELCPVCFPNPESLTEEEQIQPSGYVCIPREEFFIQRRYEKAGLLPPQERNLLINVD